MDHGLLHRYLWFRFKESLSEILACFILDLCIQGSHFRKSTISNLISLVLLKNYNQQVMGLNKGALVAFLLIVSSFCAEFLSAIDTITSTESIKDPQAILSNGDVYKLGFFSPVNSTNRYIGIWYNQIPVPTPLWVANRNMPLRDSSGILTISKDGNLILLNGQNEILWSSNVSNLFSNSTAQLTDSGNLVLKENGNGTILWDSFQHPSDTLFSRMKITANKRTGESVQLTSWKSPSDPSVGSFSASLNLQSTQEIFIWKDGNPYFRSGPWNRLVFIGVPYMKSAGVDGLNLVDEGDGSVYLSFSYVNQSFLWSFVLNSQGQFEETRWEEGMEKQVVIWQVPLPQFDCLLYGYCGDFGSCNLQKSPPICECLRGFEPKSIDEWSRGNWTSGCVRKKSLQCQTGKPEGFLRLANMKVPDFIEWSRVTEDKCREDCLTNCSCIAYAYDTGVFCMSWSGNLTDLQKFPEGGADLYIRSEYSEVDAGWKERAIIIIAVVLGSISITICAFFLWRLMISRHRARKGKVEEMLLSDTSKARSTDLNQAKFQELPPFSFQALAAATNNFNTSHKLGQGGFGIVYKGTLPDGQEIAVKRLSRTSGQGLEEFMNEVVVISKLQHRNLVRLHGCCAEGEEKMLVYEYMPNKSLDAFLFDVPTQELLDWRKRFNIIDGICRGLLYLHRDSKPRIIHRDLKASNILLDKDLNPKISDFGIAKIFGGNEDEANTRRVVGTYGYMSPEYAMEGIFSEKSDVFSFGVLLLEIVSGKRNTSFYSNEEALGLLGYAWKLWDRRDVSSLVDLVISDQRFREEIFRCIHVGLLCVQEYPQHRPAVSTAISMLNSEIVDLPIPKPPGFSGRNFVIDKELIPQNYSSCSINSVTVTEVASR